MRVKLARFQDELCEEFTLRLACWERIMVIGVGNEVGFGYWGQLIEVESGFAVGLTVNWEKRELSAHLGTEIALVCRQLNLFAHLDL